MQTTIKIATRKSVMAMHQSNNVKKMIEARYPNVSCELVQFQTDGDKFLDKPLTDIGGKALFVKALERGLFAGEADIAVHCVKDMPCVLPVGLSMPAILPRDHEGDAIVSNKYQSLRELPEGAIIGTASPRRASQLLRVRPDFQMRNLRGNVITRLEKLDAGEFDAIVLAVAGLERLNLTDRITEILDPNVFVPAIGQGALCIEALSEREDLVSLLAPFHDANTAITVLAERRVNEMLGGSCHTALGAHAYLKGDDIFLNAMVLNQQGTEAIYAQGVDDKNNHLLLAEKVANDLLKQGAEALL